MVRTAFDASTPPEGTPPASATTACIYAGGDTPRPIPSPKNVEVYTKVDFWLPGWVRSNPTPAQAAPDATEFLAWLRDNGAPAGSSTFLDVETAVTPDYVTSFGDELHTAGFKVLPYAARTNYARNPELDGYFIAAPGQEGLYPGSVATQYLYTGTYDLSRITDSVELWRISPVPAPAPTPAPAPGAIVPGVPSPLRGRVLIENGQGWYPLPDGLTAGNVTSVDVDEQNPGDAGTYVRVPAYVGAATDRSSLLFGPGPYGPAPNGTYGFTYWYEAPAPASPEGGNP